MGARSRRIDVPVLFSSVVNELCRRPLRMHWLFFSVEYPIALLKEVMNHVAACGDY